MLHELSSAIGSTEELLCLNCGIPFGSHFCPSCGASRPSERDLSLKHFFRHAVHELFSFDSKIFRTLSVLIRRPGELTNAYFSNARSKYVPPLQLFLLLNLVFFIVPRTVFLWDLHSFYSAPGSHNEISHLVIADAHAHQISQALYEERFDNIFHANQKTLIVLILPILALIFQLLYHNKHRYYVEHLVYSIHFFAFLLLFLMVVPLCFRAIFGLLQLLCPASHHAVPNGGQDQNHNELPSILILSAIFAKYLYSAARRFYGAVRTEAAVKSIFAGILVFPLILLYRDALFWATYWMI